MQSFRSIRTITPHTQLPPVKDLTTFTSSLADQYSYMTQFDPQSDKTYALRLAALGESRDVIASEDIFNDQGALLVKKGARINKSMSDRVVKFKLLKPIESSVNIENSLGPQELYRELHKQLEKLPETIQIHSALQLEKVFKQYSLELAKYPILRQKLTVMREQMPALFKQTLCVTWLSLAISRQMGLPDQQVENCFLAALSHDMGMMHIDPAILNKKEQLSPAEWRQIQAHTVIGQKLAEAIPNLNKLVARIVLEHHERCDGTGYPIGKFDDQVTQESQIIALSDSVFTVFGKKIGGRQRGLRDLLPFIQVNSESHFYNTYTALVKVLKKAKLEETCHIDTLNVESEISTLEIKNSDLTYLLSCLELIVNEISHDTQHKLLQSSRAILIQILKTVRGSGILDEGYLRWLQQVKEEKLEFAYREIADVRLMLDEIEWHLKRIIKMLDNFLDQGPDTEKELKHVIKSNLPEGTKAPSAEDYAI
ncbi:HD-GYP domain-containing protein [Ketobacter alkanivorans]|uniref:HD-GYP domain-containing protein n=1 Tax=Ketobacter alkanivorans TaxID=1917421 RepID=A0A2K9LEZ9_9GAMM|nr:HD domain-containing phosphohydrolase [Ketobacter alkanivorans]AUM10948.1 hypothetical protein Kalk_00165 [Ketobacter alkanivorans]